MILKNLALRNFRKYNEYSFNFTDSLNLIYGINGSGKTSILEAIYYLSLTKSFRTNYDLEAIKKDCEFFRIAGTFSQKDGFNKRVVINYSKSAGKRLVVDSKVVQNKLEHLGKIKVVLLSPDSPSVTDGAPATRRAFIDRILGQSDKDYLVALSEYRVLLSARNKLLQKYANQGKNSYDELFETQDDILQKHAQIICSKRKVFIEDFKVIVRDIFKRISHIEKDLDVSIQSDIPFNNKDQFITNYKLTMRESFRKDLIFGYTLRGPHRDKLKICFGETDIRYIGSQGEHKITQVALSFAEGIYLEKISGDKVIYLLDDLFAYLDSEHCNRLMENFVSGNQVFITATDKDVMSKIDKKYAKNGVNFISLKIDEK
ncbi:MAG: DNA replication and repair protein RecF [Candidatus Jordarchaeaceae archaeon]